MKMKKIIALLLVAVMALTFVACGKDDPAAKSKGVMTHDEYLAAAEQSVAVIEAYVQDTQSWWDN